MVGASGISAARRAEMGMEADASQSHQLRTPLASISILADNLATGKLRRDDEVVEHTVLIRDCCERLKKIVHSTVDLACPQCIEEAYRPGPSRCLERRAGCAGRGRTRDRRCGIRPGVLACGRLARSLGGVGGPATLRGRASHERSQIWTAGAGGEGRDVRGRFRPQTGGADPDPRPRPRDSAPRGAQGLPAVSSGTGRCRIVAWRVRPRPDPRSQRRRGDGREADAGGRREREVRVHDSSPSPALSTSREPWLS